MNAVNRLALTLVACAALTTPMEAAFAEIYKCTDSRGKVTFRDTSCPEKDQAAEKKTVAPASAPTNRPERTGENKRVGYGGYIDRARALDGKPSREE